MRALACVEDKTIGKTERYHMAAKGSRDETVEVTGRFAYFTSRK